jgi:hypothetical protein
MVKPPSYYHEDVRKARKYLTTRSYTIPIVFILAVLSALALTSFSSPFGYSIKLVSASPPAFTFDASNYPHYSINVAKCASLHTKPHPPKNFHSRTKSDRFIDGTKDSLIVNATIWTGGVTNDVEVIRGGTVWLSGGIIKKVWSSSAEFDSSTLKQTIISSQGIEILDAQGRWLTPSLLDLHSHLGVFGSPGLEANQDTNSIKGPILPFLRSIDGIDNTFNDDLKLVPLVSETNSLGPKL